MGLTEYLDTKEGLSSEYKRLLDASFQFQAQVREMVRKQLVTQSLGELSMIVGCKFGDFIYGIDKSTERYLAAFGDNISRVKTVELVAEGVGNRVYPQGIKEPKLKIIVDTIDGTRGIMYDMYSAWVLTGIAPNSGQETTLDDITLAVMTEIPVVKQGNGSVIWAVKGIGVYEEIWDFTTNRLVSVKSLVPSVAEDIENGFVVFADPLPGSGRKTNVFRERVMSRLLGNNRAKSLVFNDQVLGTGTQLYRLATGKYRFFVDIRPLEGEGICTHPYDLASLLVAREAGVIITDMQGREKLSYHLDTDTDCAFIGYANEAIRAQVEPMLLEELSKLV